MKMRMRMRMKIRMRMKQLHKNFMSSDQVYYFQYLFNSYVLYTCLVIFFERQREYNNCLISFLSFSELVPASN